MAAFDRAVSFFHGSEGGMMMMLAAIWIAGSFHPEDSARKDGEMAHGLSQEQLVRFRFIVIFIENTRSKYHHAKLSFLRTRWDWRQNKLTVCFNYVLGP